MKKSNTSNEYPCPCCGNDIPYKKNYLFKCPFCLTIIITKNKQQKREASIYYPPRALVKKGLA